MIKLNALNRNQISYCAELILCVAIIGLGIAFRIMDLGSRGLWYDELYSVIASSSVGSFSEMYSEWLRSDAHPPGYQSVLYWWFKVAPADEFWGRSLSCFFGVMCLPCFYFSTRTILTRRQSLIGVLLISVSSICVYYSQSARHYIWLIFFQILLMGVWFSIINGCALDRKKRLYLAYFIISVFLSYLHFFAFFIVHVFTLVLFFSEYRRNGRILPWIVCYGIFLILYIPALKVAELFFSSRLASLQSDIGFLPSLVEVMRQYLFGYNPSSYVGFIVILTISAWFAVLSYKNNRDKKNKNIRYLHLVFVISFGIIGIVSMFHPIIKVRYMLIFFPFFIVYLSVILSFGADKSRLFQFSLLVLLLFGSLKEFKKYRKYENQGWDKAAKYTLAHYDQQSKIYVLSAEGDKTAHDYMTEKDVRYFYVRLKPFFSYYFKRFSPETPIALHPIDFRADNLKQSVLDALKEYTRVFVLAGHHLYLKESNPAMQENNIYDIETTRFKSTIVYVFRTKTQAAESAHIASHGNIKLIDRKR